MKGFFWAVVAVYLFLYFYAVYVYEGFTLVSALGVLVVIGIVAWLLFRNWTPKNAGDAVGEIQPNTARAKKTEMKWYQSPFPYLLLFVLVGLIAFVMR